MFQPIGTIHTPYIDEAPYQPLKDDKGEFYIVLQETLTPALEGLNHFKYIYIIYFIDKLPKTEVNLNINPPWIENIEIGLFASRAPNRPNPIGLSIVKIKKIEKNIIYTSGLDVLDNTPLLDIKPYIRELDSKSDANYGWLNFENEEDKGHLLLHIKGIPH
ncbi:tRNA (N6-threonylcarbamoyladenosine(37)-N6)-methyltransferase TrmO [Promethearchaeum syntrophicum]|uniref:tRNA (N6-threonylcarbamoyladenosine(37)-N6)-methyltransferase TrmO n=1 Tax=Promethearchaeum syntrophicum TaxID=2594042 RepID=A0AC61ZTW7_9ARCH|nr:tRNA (N6-threonylcarbamoyladenosine(37)-N6)-methyltransferase TrmO [Candidatus Prometheoarchaeum syntrophicum]